MLFMLLVKSCFSVMTHEGTVGGKKSDRVTVLGDTWKPCMPRQDLTFGTGK